MDQYLKFVSWSAIDETLTKRDLCINRNNHHKPTFHPPGDFLNPALAPLGQGLKNHQVGENWILPIIPVYAKASHSKKTNAQLTSLI